MKVFKLVFSDITRFMWATSEDDVLFQLSNEKEFQIIESSNQVYWKGNLVNITVELPKRGIFYQVYSNIYI